MTNLLVTGIEWDTDGVEIDLPTTVVIEETDPADSVADMLSDKYGFCVNTYESAVYVTESMTFEN